jgi:hypothetical protein
MNRRTLTILVALILTAGAVSGWERNTIKANDREAARLRRQVDEGRQHVQQLRTELDGVPAPLAAPTEETAASLVPPSGEMAYDERMRALVRKVYQLKHWIETTPGENFPEFRFAYDSGWFDAVMGNSLSDDRELRRAAQSVRDRAQGNFLNIVGSALHGYAQASGGQSPKSLAELAPFFVCPVDEGC